MLSKHIQGRPELAALIAEVTLGLSETDEGLLAKSIEKLEKLPKTINTGNTSIYASLLLSHIRNDVDAFSVARKELVRRTEQSPDKRDSVLLSTFARLTYASRIEADGTDGAGAQVLRQEALAWLEKGLNSAKKIDSKVAIRELENTHSYISALMAIEDRDAPRLANIIELQRSKLNTDLSFLEQSEQIRMLMVPLYTYASIVRGEKGREAIQELSRYLERAKILNIEIQKNKPALNLAARSFGIATGQRTTAPNGMDSACISNANIQLMQAMILVLQQSIIASSERPDPAVLKQALTMFDQVELAFSLQPMIYQPPAIELFRLRIYSLMAATEHAVERKTQWIDQAKQQLTKSRIRLDSCFCALFRKELLREELALKE